MVRSSHAILLLGAAASALVVGTAVAETSHEHDAAADVRAKSRRRLGATTSAGDTPLEVCTVIGAYYVVFGAFLFALRWYLLEITHMSHRVLLPLHPLLHIKIFSFSKRALGASKSKTSKSSKSSKASTASDAATSMTSKSSKSSKSGEKRSDEGGKEERKTDTGNDQKKDFDLSDCSSYSTKW